MKITIITVSYNSASTIEETIQSVLSQRYENIEYIIIDGLSTDATIEIIKKYRSAITKWISEPDTGIYDAMNKGIGLATGDVIGFLNSDDVFANSFVTTKIASCFENNAVDICYSDLIYTERNNLNKIVRYWRSCEFKLGYFSKGWAPPHPTFYVRNHIYAEFGVFDLSLMMGNDIELMMRFLERYKLNTVYVPHVFVKMRNGGESNKSIKNVIIQNIAIIHALKKLKLPFSLIIFVCCKIFLRFKQFFIK